MVTVVFVRNPFNPYQSRIIEKCAAGRSLKEYVKPYEIKLPGQELTVQLNGSKMEAMDGLVPENAFIVIMPHVGKGGGKNPLQLIASIALSVVAMGVGSVLAGGAFFGSAAVGIGSWGFASYLGAAATMFLGGSLVSKLGPKISVGQYNTTESDPTYGWDGVTTMEGQGNAIAVTYGTVKSGGQSIAKYVSNDSNDQILNWLVCAGEGVLEIEDIKLNDNPIENYKDVSVEIRTGTNNQEIISNFNDTIETKQLGYEILNDEWRLDEVSGNSAEGLIIDIEFSQGLYHANDDGSLGTAWVDIAAQYRLKVEGQEDEDGWAVFVSSGKYVKPNRVNAALNNSNAANGAYSVKVIANTTVSDDEMTTTSYSLQVYAPGVATDNAANASVANIDGSGSAICGPFNFPDKALLRNLGGGTQISITIASDGRVSAAQSTAVRRQFRCDDIPAGEYQVRVKASARSASTTSSRDGVKCWWTGLSAVIYDDFIYPNKALIGLKALASNQLSGNTPTLSFIKTRSTVLVYNPNLPGYEEKDATNPAWAAYDFTHVARLLDDPRDGTQKVVVYGAPKELMMYQRFADWAEFCDEKDLHINIEIATTGEYWQKVNTDIAPVGRGQVIQFGTKFGCIWDHVQEPVQMFTMGNIVTGSFTENYLSLKDRADCVELSFNNKDKDYTRDTIVAYGPNYDSADIVNNPTQISMDGITDYNQAYREAKYQLYCNSLLLRSVSFSAQIDAIACMVGDVILVAHDVPRWSFSGRIYEVNGIYAVTVPIDPDEIDQQEQYSFQYRSIDDKIYTVDVTTISTVGSGMVQVQVTGFDPDDPPQPNDIFAMGPRNATSKPFTVTSITRSTEFERKIEAIEYNAAVFDENYDIPMPDYSMSEETDVQNVINLQANQVAYKDKQGVMHCKMFVSWSLPEGALADYFTVLISSDYGTSWQIVANPTGFDTNFETLPYTAYMVRVITVYQLRQSSGVTIGPIAAGEDTLPPDVTVLNIEVLGENGSETRRFWWDFTYPDPDDIAGFRIKYMQGNSLNWETGYQLHTGVVTQQPFETKALRQGVHTVMIKAVDNAGQESRKIAYAILNLGDPLEDNVLYKNVFAESNWEHVVTDGVIQEDGTVRAAQNSFFWSEAGAPFWVQDNYAMWYERYAAFNLYAQFIAPASGSFWLKYEIEGPAVVEYRKTGTEPFWNGTGVTAFWNAADWAMWPDEANMFLPYTCKINVKAGEVIQVRFRAPDNAVDETILHSLIAIIDVPDREEHFENINIPEDGVNLPVATPYYYTTAVRIDAVQDYTGDAGISRIVIISRNPCRIQVLDINGNAVEATVDVTWQGFINEVIKDA
ncbi:MAG: hypothetical protein DBY32_04730 [Phascolarctobacterium sp.]|nr:MAG: hypothetical protein DBY32_04730 [Phascolarctobacterium sp.]